MLQQEKPGDYILATGTATSVRDFASAAFAAAGMTLNFSGQGVQEIGLNANTERLLVRVNPRFFRAADPVGLIGSPEHARQMLSWSPITSGAAVARAMVLAESNATAPR